jgi:hypothetical protein
MRRRLIPPTTFEYARQNVRTLLNEQVDFLTRGKTIPLERVKVEDLDRAVRQVEDLLRNQIKNRTLPPGILEPFEGGGFKIGEAPQNIQGETTT